MWNYYIKQNGEWKSRDTGPVYRKENGQWVKHEGSSLDGKRYVCEYLPTKYVSFGDSIAAGHAINSDWERDYGTGSQYGANGNTETVIVSNCYTDLIRSGLKEIYGERLISAKSFARSGDKVEDLIEKLDHAVIREAIAKANLVVICIGANNVLGPALNSIESYINNGTPTLDALQAQIDANMAILRDNANANSYYALFNKLHTINPNAKYVFTNIYNPLKYMWLDESTAANHYEDGFFGPLLHSILNISGVEDLVRPMIYNTEIVQKIFDRVNGVSRNGSDGLAAWTEKWVGQLNEVLTSKIAEFNNPNFIVVDTKSVFESFPDRPIPATYHYNDLVNVEFTRGFKVDHMDWGRFWDNISYSDIINDLDNVVNTVVTKVVSEVIVPDIDPHPETYGHYVMKQVISDALGWETLPRYTITFNANGGAGAMASREVVGVDNLTAYTTLPENKFSHPQAGYRFTGWNTSPDGRGTSYPSGQIVGLTGDLTLYAQWSNLYAVVYRHSKDADGYSDSNTGPMEKYALWVAGTEYGDLGKFSNPAQVYYLPYGTRIGVVVQDRYDKGHSYVNFNGTMVAGKSSDARYEFTLTADTDIHFEWNATYLVEISNRSYWNCYITTH